MKGRGVKLRFDSNQYEQEEKNNKKTMKNPLVIAHINDWRVTGLPQSKDVGVSMLAFGLGGPCHARNKGNFQLIFKSTGCSFALSDA